jgi:hypothetical protein
VRPDGCRVRLSTSQWHGQANSGLNGSSPHGGQSPRGCCLTRCPLSSGSAGPVVIDSDWAGVDSGLDCSSTRGTSSRERGRPRCPLISGSAGPDQGRHGLGRRHASWCIVSRARPVETTPLVGRADRVRAALEVGAQLGDFAREAKALIVEVEHVTNPYLASRWTVPTAISRAQIHRCSIRAPSRLFVPCLFVARGPYFGDVIQF